MDLKWVATDELITELQDRFVDSLVIYTVPEKQGSTTIPHITYSGGGVAALGLMQLAKRLILDELTGQCAFVEDDDK